MAEHMTDNLTDNLTDNQEAARTERMMPGDVVRHFKGRLYEILYFAHDSETREEVVVYRALYGERGVWVRPKAMFFSPVDRAKYPDAPQDWRFERVKNSVKDGRDDG